MLKRGEGMKPAAGALNSVIGEGSQLVGRLRIQGSIRVDGELEGSLTASEAVVIGRTGKAKADLRAKEIVVSGRVEGKIIAQERVELQTGARVEGDMWAQSLLIDEGVVFTGNCSMGEEAREYSRSSPRESQGQDDLRPGAPAQDGVPREPGSFTVVDSPARRFR